MPDEQRINLPSTVPPDEAGPLSGEDVVQAEQEKAWIESELAPHTVEAAKLRNQLAKAYIDNMDADRELRKTYAARILGYLELYSVGVGLLLLLDGYSKTGFVLPENVAATLVGSTAVAAIGLVGFIARGLFRLPPPPPPGH